jgi:predicted GIY-YIG superfamily endonuclease
MTTIYVLKLQNGNYYVGKSDNPERRFLEHISGSGSAWTRKYPPTSIKKIYKMKSPLDEDARVKKLMLKHGIDSVRGGSYSSITLSDEQRRTLNREIWGATDRCLKCGRGSHWASECRVQIAVTNNCCYRCGRNSHWVSDCYAGTHINGYYLD